MPLQRVGFCDRFLQHETSIVEILIDSDQLDNGIPKTRWLGSYSSMILSPICQHPSIEPVASPVSTDDFRLEELLGSLHEAIHKFPDNRTGDNIQYSMEDVGLKISDIKITQKYQ